ncbi:hypothetical protein IC218_01135 [Clostridioides sp. ES-S-0005-03]|nr:hypothetical protein [Clostridioides sp. ES-S-0005-03]UDN48676.1 hypothetical protein JJJ25_06345 [Clostridioides sp. ES-S-0173-01]
MNSTVENNELKFRYTVESDTNLVLKFIKELASYENMLDEVVVTEKILNH